MKCNTKINTVHQSCCDVCP